MENGEELPWISRVPWQWTVVISLVTGGLYALFIGLYLSIWVRAKSNAGVAALTYLTISLLGILGFLSERWPSIPMPLEAISSVGTSLWIIAGFLLRRELRIYFRRPDGSMPEMSLLWTALFSVFYLNYCVWAEGDTA